MKRIFFDWAKPLIAQVAPTLINRLAEKSCLILVPTLSSGEILQQALVTQSPHQALLLPPIMTTAAFKKQCLNKDLKTASPCQSALAWVKILRDCSEGELLQIINNKNRSFPELLGIANSILRIESTLSSELLSFADIIPQATNDPLRWEILARLSDRVTCLLAEQSLLSSLNSDRNCVEKPNFPADIEQIILLAQPDPTPISLRILEKWMEAGNELEVWIHANKSHADTFDAWGRPLQEFWNQRRIDIPKGNHAISLSANPKDSSRQVISFFASHHISAEEAAIGIADPSFETSMEASLHETEWKPYRSEGSSLQQSALHHLSQSLMSYMQEPSLFQPIDQALRNPVLLTALNQHNAYPLIQALDRLKSKHHPETIAHALKNLRSHPEAFQLVKNAEAWMKTWSTGKIGKSALSLGEQLTQHYKRHGVDAWNKCAQEISDLEETAKLSNANDALYLLDQIYTKQTIYADPSGTHIKLQGWLELLYQDAPYLALLGMHEGCVPDAQIADPYLPESFKLKLGIRGRAHRYARDAYLFVSIMERRRTQGCLQVFISKVNTTQDPLFPSSLLMRCTKEELPSRISYLLEENIPPLSFPPIREQSDFPLKMENDINPWQKDPQQAFSPSLFNDFLQCPKRFWLKNVCKMKELQISNSLNAMDYGSLVHAALETLQSDELRNSTDVTHIHEALYSNYKQKLAELLATEKTSNSSIDIQTRFTERRLLYAAEAHAHAISEGWMLTNTEHKIDRWEIMPRCFISMKIDAIYTHTDTGAIRIIDYKTSKKGKNPQEVHLTKLTEEKLYLQEILLPLVPWYKEESTDSKGKEKITNYRWANIQLPLYALWARASFPHCPIEVAYVNLPLSKDKSGYEAWETLDDLLLDQAEECTQGLIQSIRNASFNTLPSAENLKWDVYTNDILTPILNDSGTSADDE